MSETLTSADRPAAGSTSYRTKLIEVALPLEAINKEAAREKSIRHGHPSTLHLWWARRPLAACRAVLFGQLVDDPSAVPEEFPTEEAQEAERQRLFRIIEELVKWENTTNETVLMAARREIARSVARTAGVPGPETEEDIWRILREHAPPVLDPFCGGGSIPLEAQRLGLEAHASDLNPVAVLITKAMIEIPPKFAGMPPVNPEERQKTVSGGSWPRATGLAADVRYYGKWMRDEAFKRIGHLYPKVQVPKEQGGGEATVIAWLWARTVKCPNPACGAQMPLVRSFALSTKKGKETWVEPIVDHEAKTVRFEVRGGKGKPPEASKIGRGAQFRCLVCEQVAEESHIKAEAKAGRMGQQLMAIVAEGAHGRTYVAPSPIQDEAAQVPPPEDVPRQPLPDNTRWFSPPVFGMDTFDKLFTPRQLIALTTFSDLVGEARERVLADARAAGMPDDGQGIADGGRGAMAYADAVATYLALVVDKVVDRLSTICSWDSSPKMEAIRNTFARQAIPMTWDFAEGNPFSDSTGNWLFGLEWVANAVDKAPAIAGGRATQQNAVDYKAATSAVVSTDPPYYDNIGYADLSDFFYLWLRRSLRIVYPSLFGTLLVPKADELVATPYRFGGSKDRAEAFFERGLGEAFARMEEEEDAEAPLTIYYAFKQAESEGAGNSPASTGWETMLSGLLHAGFSISGTWPMRSELSNRMLASGTNALASSIVLVCRPRPTDAHLATRREFVSALRAELPPALAQMQRENIAPVDLAQAAIGPGMRVFSRYSRVIEADGTAMGVRDALGLINQILYEVEEENESEYDPDTRWAITWFHQYGMAEGSFGDAETLSKAKDTSVGGLQTAGILEARAGKVRLLRRAELPADWNPQTDRRLTVWEITQHLIRALDVHGEAATADLLRRVGGLGEAAKDLSYALYLVAERKKWTEEGIAYNSLVVAWPEISRLAAGSQDGQIGLGV